MKKIRLVIICVMMLFVLGACGKEEGAGESEAQSTAAEEVKASWTIPLETGEWRDNSLDSYMADMCMKFETFQVDFELSGGVSNFFLDNGNLISYKKHLSSSSKKSLDRVVVMNEAGNQIVEKQWKYGESGIWSDQIWQLGRRLDEDGYVYYRIEDMEDGQYQGSFVLTDSQLEMTEEIVIPFFQGSELIAVNQLLVDGEGKFHVLYCPNGKNKYLIFSEEGELLMEKEIPDYNAQFQVLDEKVTVSYTVNEGTGSEFRLSEFEPESGREKDIFKTEELFIVKAVSVVDADRLLYADAQGIYLMHMGDGSKTLLYEWINHGMKPERIFLHMEGELLQVVYEEAGERYYLPLAPVKEKVEIEQIEFAVSPYNREKYEMAVVQFNKKYPTIHIEIRDDYEETALNTQLVAGDGPVLIDTALTGFAEHEKLWAPLDGLWEALGMEEDFIPQFYEMGTIHETQYGVSTSFYLDTFVTYGEKQNWSYDDFVKKLEDNPSLKAVSNDDYNWRWSSLMLLFNNRRTDSYFYDSEKGLNKDRVESFLNICEKYCDGQKTYKIFEGLEEGEVLGNQLSIRRPEQMAYLYLRFGDGLSYSGYPTESGSVNFVEGSSPIAMRNSASEREKAIGAAFLKELLTYDSQKEMIYDDRQNCSVRKDVLERQILAVNSSTLVLFVGMEQCRLEETIDTDVLKEIFYGELNNAQAKVVQNKPATTILWEELERYFTEGISRQMLLEQLESRINLYLSE